MNYKVEKYRDLMKEEKIKRKNYAFASACFWGISALSLMHTKNDSSMLLESLSHIPVATSIITAYLGTICAQKANERKLTK